jgi:hypothetical protein
MFSAEEYRLFGLKAAVRCDTHQGPLSDLRSGSLDVRYGTEPPQLTKGTVQWDYA